MSQDVLTYSRIAQLVGLSILIVQSWCQHKAFSSETEAVDFFEAKPFIKWV